MDKNQQLYDIYLKTFLIVRAGVALDRTHYGRSTGGAGTFKEYEGEELAAVALGVNDGKAETRYPESKAEFMNRLKALVG
jgi:hypothetical protein